MPRILRNGRWIEIETGAAARAAVAAQRQADAESLRRTQLELEEFRAMATAHILHREKRRAAGFVATCP